MINVCVRKYHAVNIIGIKMKGLVHFKTFFSSALKQAAIQ